MKLHLVAAASEQPEGFEVPERDLRTVPTRPGVSQSRLSLRLPADLAAVAADTAREEGLREDTWIGIAIESERALRAAGARGAEATALLSELDAAAGDPLPPVPGAPQRATGFAAALRALRPDLGARVTRIGAAGGGELTVYASVPFYSELAWRRGAIVADLSLGEWASEHLGTLPQGRLLWEAAAVEAGETLVEWVLAQAARRRSSR